MTVNKPADQPEFTVCRNASRPHLVHFAIGTGQRGYDLDPETVERVAYDLLAAASEVRGDARDAN